MIKLKKKKDFIRNQVLRNFKSSCQYALFWISFSVSYFFLFPDFHHLFFHFTDFGVFIHEFFDVQGTGIPWQSNQRLKDWIQETSLLSSTMQITQQTSCIWLCIQKVSNYFFLLCIDVELNYSEISLNLCDWCSRKLG